MSEVRGSGWEELPRVRGQYQPGGDTPRPRSGAAAERSYQASEVRAAAGRSHPRPRPGPAAGRSNPRSGGCAGAGGLRGAIPR